MGARPPAEADLHDGLVQDLLADQHPDLAALPIGAHVEGWDCWTVRLGDSLAVRLPRRAVVAPAVEHEQVWLPRLAPSLPVPVPVPLRRGTPSAAFPWPWSVVPWFEGVAAATLPPASRTTWAGALADVVVSLHRPAPHDAPVNEVRGTPLATQDANVRARIAQGAGTSGAVVLAQWERALAAHPWPGPPLWLHGDLHPANLLVSDGGLAAVLDFVDLTAGDPATDLATAWLTFDASGRAAFRAAVTAACGTDAATWSRAGGWAVALGTAMLAGAADDPVIAAVGAHTLRQLVDDPP